MLKVNEIFTSLQGEGKSIGMPKLFIRLSGCTLNCTFCDSVYHNEYRELSEIDEQLLIENHDWVITGGEPLLQQPEIVELVKIYRPDTVEIETNGTIAVTREFRDMEVTLNYNISPKEKRQQIHQGVKCEPILLDQVTSREAIVKFVYSDLDSKLFIEYTAARYNIPNKNIWIMPEGKTKHDQEQKMQEVWEYCLRNKYNFSPRLHIMVFNDKRGV